MASTHQYDVRFIKDEESTSLETFETLQEARTFASSKLNHETKKIIIMRMSLETRTEVIVYDQELEHKSSKIMEIRSAKLCKTREDVFSDSAHKSVRQLLTGFLSSKTALTYELYHSQRLLSNVTSNTNIMEKAINHLAKIQSSTPEIFSERKMEIYGLIQDIKTYNDELTDSTETIGSVKPTLVDLNDTAQQSSLLTALAYQSTSINTWIDKLMYYITAYEEFSNLPGSDHFFDRIFSEILSWDTLIQQFTDSLPDPGTRAFVMLKMCHNDLEPTSSMNEALQKLSTIVAEGDFKASRLSLLLAALRELRKAKQLTTGGKDFEIHMFTKIIELLIKPDGTLINPLVTSEILLQRASELTKISSITSNIDSQLSVLVSIMPSSISILNLLVSLTTSPTGSQHLPDITRYMHKQIIGVKTYNDLIYEHLSLQSRTSILLKLSSKIKNATFFNNRGSEFAKQINNIVVKMLKEAGVFQEVLGTHEPPKEQIPGVLKLVLAGNFNTE